jgi:hypothetical protein
VSIALDRLVAEKVMGYAQHEHMQDCWTHHSFANGYLQRHYFTPSTSIAAAWEVVEHLRKQTKDDGTRKYLVSIIDSIGNPEVQIETICGEDYNSWSGPCDARSICCAALLAVGVSESEIQEACK